MERHVSKLTIRGNRATGLCPFHPDKNPSLSVDLEKAVFHCFGCGASGGVRKFAELLGEEWGSPADDRSPRERAARAALARRRQAEEQARAILQQRKDEKDDAVWAVWQEANADAAFAADILSLFHRRPDLAEEFPDLVARTEKEYSEAVFRRSILEARIDGELP